MKATNIRELTHEELQHQFDETRKEIFNLRVQKSTGQLENPARLRILRRDVARMETILTEREKAAQ